jgi:hypothetical protein
MKNQGFIRLFAFVFVLLIVSLACYGGSTPTPMPVQQLPTAVPQQNIQPTAVPQNSGGVTTFIDQKKLYAIDIPSDWVHTQTVDTAKNNYYTDKFTSPDGQALIENLVYDDGTAFTGSDKARFALFLLNTYYSKTGKEGDIRVSDDRIMDDASERLTWTSKGNGTSGISFLETRGTTTFLFFTVLWVNSAKDTYFDTLNTVIASYRVP